MARQNQVLDFIGSTFRSVWALEVLRLLAQAPDSAFAEEDIIAKLRASKAAIGQSVARLERLGLLTVEDGRVRFCAASADLEMLVTDAIDLYSRRPDMVRRTIVSSTSPGLTAFADAFRLRKDR
ncbi:MAG: hypothetical protein EOP13_12410 [Pseudomonas sp.]|uniref:hypothetical protein n=1 Tax=Pseudomonas sp. TaxID=306 RepID=UPI001203E473|nr:hypothetical protein [Pseudomonas sp.]RZI73309.1 MAG: hypothetical protein EOP13_12410 [Pseudomonas sp.]